MLTQTWNICGQYHYTLQSHKLILTTLLQLDFRVLHLHNLKSFSTTSLCTTHAQPNFHWISRTWFKLSTLMQPEIFIYIVKWHILRYTFTPCFLLYLQNIISVAYDSYYMCVYVFSYIYCIYTVYILVWGHNLYLQWICYEL